MPYTLLDKQVNFRPTFGNDEHILIINKLLELESKRNLVTKWQNDGWGDAKKTHRMLETIESLEVEIKYLIDKQK